MVACRAGIGIVLSSLVGCAVPAGLGPAASPDFGADNASLSTSLVVGTGQDGGQVDAEVQAPLGWKHVGLSLGVNTTLKRTRTDDGNTVVASGFLPYVRPMIRIGEFQLDIAASGMGFGGGGGGVVYGVAEGRASYVFGNYGVSASALAMGSELTSENGKSSSGRHVAVGFEYRFDMGGRTEFGVGLDVRGGRETYRCEGCGTAGGSFAAAVINLRVLRELR